MWTIHLKFWKVSRCVPDPVGMFLPLQWVWAPVWPSPWPRPTPSVDVDEWNLSGFEQNHRALTSFCEEDGPSSHSHTLLLWQSRLCGRRVVKLLAIPLLPIPIDTSCCYFATRTACRNSHGTSTPFQGFLLSKDLLSSESLTQECPLNFFPGDLILKAGWKAAGGNSWWRCMWRSNVSVVY